MEHGPYSVETVQQMIRAAEARGISAVVRVPENSETSILRVLDVGAKCIQVPQISTAKDAGKVVKSAMFHPKGERGMCRYVRAGEYTAIEKEEHFGKSNYGTSENRIWITSKVMGKKAPKKIRRPV